MWRSTVVFYNAAFRAVWVSVAIAMSLGCIWMALSTDDGLLPGVAGAGLFGWSALSVFQYPTIADLRAAQRR